MNNSIHFLCLVSCKLNEENCQLLGGKQRNHFSWEGTINSEYTCTYLFKEPVFSFVILVFYSTIYAFIHIVFCLSRCLYNTLELFTLCEVQRVVSGCVGAVN